MTPNVFQQRQSWRELLCPERPDQAAYQSFVGNWVLRRDEVQTGPQECLDVFLRALPLTLRNEALRGDPNRSLEQIHNRLCRHLATTELFRDNLVHIEEVRIVLIYYLKLI